MLPTISLFHIKIFYQYLINHENKSACRGESWMSGVTQVACLLYQLRWSELMLLCLKMMWTDASVCTMGAVSRKSRSFPAFRTALPALVLRECTLWPCRVWMSPLNLAIEKNRHGYHDNDTSQWKGTDSLAFLAIVFVFQQTIKWHLLTVSL